MDEGKDSLDTAGARNADAFDTPAQPPTHPANSTVSSEFSADKKIISSANLAPPTALSAPLPTDPLHPIQTVGTGKGDLWVGDRRRRSGKKLLVSGLVLGGVLVAGVVAWLVWRGGGTSTPARLTSSLVNFASYALSDDGQQTLENGYVGTKTYRLEQQVKLAQAAGADSNAEYFTNLNAAFNAFYGDAQELFSAETIFTDSDLTAMRERIAVIRQFVSGNMLTSQDIVFLYLTQGDAAMRQTVESTAQGYESLADNAVAQEYAAVIRETALLIALTYDTYAQHGCVQGSTLNTACVASILEDTIDVLDLNDDRLTDFIYSAAWLVERATFTIYWSMNETTQD